mgnify:CR=1 FL=1
MWPKIADTHEWNTSASSEQRYCFMESVLIYKRETSRDELSHMWCLSLGEWRGKEGEESDHVHTCNVADTT